MTRGRRRKRNRTSRKSTDENDHSHTGQGEEIATPPAQCTSPRRGTDMNSSDHLQTEESGIGNDIYYAASAVSPNANHEVQRVPLFPVDCIAEPVANAAQRLEDQESEDPDKQDLFLQCLTPVWHRDIRVFTMQKEEYSDEANFPSFLKANQYSETLVQSQDDFSPDFEVSDEDDEYSHLQNPTKTPIISKDFLRVLPHCPIIHWASQMKNYPKFCFCPCSNSSQPWRGKKKIFINGNHGCKATAMTPQELLRHLKNEGDSTHTAISIYLETLNSFSRGHSGKNPGVNSKKKLDSDEKEKEEEKREEEEEEVAAKKNPDSDDEEKEEEEREEEEEEVAAKKKRDSDEEGKEKEERDQEEGEVAATLDSNDVSCEQVDTYACDHAKQGIETQFALDNHTDSVLEGMDGCESANNEPDDIEKDDTDVT
jgi:hypothetical protein